MRLVYRLLGVEPTANCDGTLAIRGDIKKSGIFRSNLIDIIQSQYEKWWDENKSEDFFDPNLHCPAPWEDRKLPFSSSLNYYDDYFFGFASLDQYREYFKSEKFRWFIHNKHNAFMSEYEVDSRYVKDGNHQLIFNLKRATLLRYYPVPI